MTPDELSCRYLQFFHERWQRPDAPWHDPTLVRALFVLVRALVVRL